MDLLAALLLVLLGVTLLLLRLHRRERRGRELPADLRRAGPGSVKGTPESAARGAMGSTSATMSGGVPW